VFFAVLAARSALGALGGGPLAASETPAGRGGGAAAVYVVQPGDTYWTIARHLQPTGDVRTLVDRLSAEHAGAALQPGEQLALR
jgi:LysM repeat protein